MSLNNISKKNLRSTIMRRCLGIGGTLFAATGYLLSGPKMECMKDINISDDFKEEYRAWVEDKDKSCSLWDHNWDKREAEKKAPRTARRHLIFIRHGQYNDKGEEDSERYLSKLGEAQARATGEKLMVSGINFDTVVQSNLLRAQQTSEIITSYLPSDVTTVTCSMLAEGSPSPCEPPVGRKRSDYRFFVDGARIEAAFRKFFHRPASSEEGVSYTLVICHANVIRYFLCRALQLPPEAWLRFSLDHCSLTWFSIDHEGHVVLRRYGDSGHLHQSLLTTR